MDETLKVRRLLTIIQFLEFYHTQIPLSNKIGKFNAIALIKTYKPLHPQSGSLQ